MLKTPNSQRGSFYVTSEYITAKQAAEILGLKYHTLLARVRSGSIKAERIGWAVVFKPEEIERVKHHDH